MERHPAPRGAFPSVALIFGIGITRLIGTISLLGEFYRVNQSDEAQNQYFAVN